MLEPQLFNYLGALLDQTSDALLNWLKVSWCKYRAVPKLQKWKFAHRTLEGIFLLLQRLTLYSHSTSSESLHTGEMEISSYLPDLSNIYHDKFVKDKILERAVHSKKKQFIILIPFYFLSLMFWITITYTVDLARLAAGQLDQIKQKECSTEATRVMRSHIIIWAWTVVCLLSSPKKAMKLNLC